MAFVVNVTELPEHMVLLELTPVAVKVILHNSVIITLPCPVAVNSAFT
jgi:hypothetical protein